MNKKSPGRFPEGYMKYLYTHQYNAKNECEESKDIPKVVSEPVRDKKPDKDLYHVKGLSGATNANTSGANTSGDCDTMEFTSSQGHVLMITWSEIDIIKYFSVARPYITKAIKAPLSVKPHFLKEVSCCIVNRAWEDASYFFTAAKLCAYISQAEKEAESGLAIPTYTFQRSLVEKVQLTADDWQKMRDTNEKYWFSFCQFLAHLYVWMSKFDITPMGLEKVSLGLMQRLCSSNEDELEMFCWMVEACGPWLSQSTHIGHPERFHGIINTCRDLFFDVNVKDPRGRQRLLLVIELHASGWSLSNAAKNFYRPFLSTAA